MKQPVEPNSERRSFVRRTINLVQGVRWTSVRAWSAEGQFSFTCVFVGSLAAVLICAAAGCKRDPKSLTPIPGISAGMSAPAGNAPSFEGSRITGTPAEASRLYLGGGGGGFGGLGAPLRFQASPVPRGSDGVAKERPVISSTDELWVISRSISNSGPGSQTDDAQPGSGAMVVEQPDSEDIVPLPLRHTDVKAQVSAYIATVEVRQTFHNPFSGKIEAKYVFPLPQDAAINEFVMTIGERRIRGIIRERKEAEQIYAEAKSQGYVASLLTQERPNIFTQSVANIEPGKSIDVSITYFNTLAYRDGRYEFVFPMVVGPRFNPPGFENGVEAVPRERAAGILPGKEQPTTVAYLKPTERSGHDIALSLDVDAGVAIEQFESKSHVIESRRSSDANLHVELGRLDRIPNKDFVLRYRVAGNRLKSDFLTHRDERGGFFTLMVHPPAELKQLGQHPIEMVFVLDCSGSMNGEPIAQAKAAIRRALQQMRPEDSFQIIRFSNDASKLGKRPLPATPENVRQGLAYVESLNGTGGTMMIEGIKAALDFPHDPERLRFVVFMTDGYIGNDREILTEVHRRLNDSRIFSFGVGSSPNGYLLDGLARIGKGAVAYLGLQDDAARIMDDFVQRIRHPALMDVAIDWGSLQVTDVYPSKLPDVFVGRPLVVTGRFTGNAPTSVKVRGKGGREPVEIAIPVNPANSDAQHAGITSVWARKKLMDLADRERQIEDPTLPTQIKQVALDYSLMSAYTAFVAVDSLTHTGNDPATTVPQAVPVPEGVKYENTVK